MPTVTPRLPGVPALPPLVPLRTIGTIAGAFESMQALGVLPGGASNPLALWGGPRAVLRRAQRPPSVFAGEWAALRAEAGRQEQRQRALETATYLGLAGRLVAPAAAEKVRELEGVLSRLDEVIRTDSAGFPVRDVPEPTALSPSIRTLRVRVRGMAGAEAVRAWVDELRRELNAAPYPVPARS